MDSEQFREFAKAVVDYIADYWDNVEDRPVVSRVKPGYLGELIPDEAPTKGEDWRQILQDMDTIVMPGITHWTSPHFHAFFPSGSSYPAIVGEMLSAAFGCVGLSWMACPAYTELEVVMMNWLGKLLNLPDEFLNCSEGPGGGVIQGSASESTLVGLLAAKEKKVKEILSLHPELTEAEVKGRLVAYSSDQSNSSVEKSGLLGSMPMKLLPTDEKGQLRGETLEEAFRRDKEEGLIPCYVVGTLGTTPTCAFDKLEELGPVCRRENVWFHIDAAYAGTAFVCPEYRYLMKGVEYADSFNFNPHKWMLVNFDCSALWVRDAKYLVEAFNVERIYLKDQHQGLTPEYRHWQISLGRRFRALKLWFVLRTYGEEGIQKHVRNHIALAKYFADLVQSDPRFEVFSCSMGLVCFKVRGDDSLTVKLMEKVQERENIFVVPGHFRDYHLIRFAVCSRLTEKRHIEFAWSEFSSQADEIMGKIDGVTNKTAIKIKMAATRCPNLNGEEKSK